MVFFFISLQIYCIYIFLSTRQSFIAHQTLEWWLLLLGVPTDSDGLTSDIVTILAYLCDKLSVTLSSANTNKPIIPLLLEGIFAILKNVPVAIRDNHNFIDLIW